MSKTFAVVLAAGQGTRMRSKLYKVLHPVCGKPMVQHVVDTISAIGVEQIVTIVGHGAEKVKAQLGTEIAYALQSEQLGTAHAVIQAAPLLEKETGTTLVICGDTPLFREETLQELLTWHEKTGAKATILSSILTDSTGYGRIVRASDNQVEKIVEHKDASAKEKEIKEINTGTYCFDNQALFAALKLVGNENVQGEYYLPDVIEILKQQGERIEAFVTPHFEETLGVNDRFALSEASAIMKKRILKQHMLNGVTILDADSTYIEADVTIGRDTVLHPGTVVRTKSTIGEDCEIGPNTEIIASTVYDEVVIRQSVVTESTIAKGATVGPFAHIRPGSNVGENNRIGNFVELKNTTLGTGSKVSHLSYVGDAEIGANVNVGCGAVTVNYDGYKKYKTIIEDESFIGCNANLIAPITVEKGSYVAAGSTISKNVPQGALAIARARQENKEGYAARLKK